MSEQAPPSSCTMYMEVNSQRYGLNVEQIYMLAGHTDSGKLCHEHIINVDEKDVDVKHCIVGVNVGEGIFICDMLSISGTYLNGTRLTSLKKTFVQHGDVVRLGRSANIKFFNEQMETSHNSSGYSEANKNTSGIICSTPESSSQRELCMSRMYKSQSDDNHFLVPAIPNRIGNISIDNKFKNIENETSSNSRISFGLNSSNNQSDQSDSFSIPETQYCKARTSTESNQSLDVSDAGEGSTKSGFNLDSSATKGGEGEDDDFCIPETQDALPGRQMPRNLQDDFVTALNTLKEKSVDLKDSEDEESIDDLDGSQFRICTQEYNEGFGEEEDNESVLHSQVIPLIKHTTVLLNASSNIQTPSDKIKDKDGPDAGSVQEQDNELDNIVWNAFAAQNTKENANNITSNCSTPDLFEFNIFDNVKDSDNCNDNNDNLFEDNVANALEDAEDVMATQAFPSKNANNKMQKEMNIVCDNKDDQPFLTLSDKKMIANVVEDEEDFMATQAFQPKNANNNDDKIQKEMNVVCENKDDEQILTVSDKKSIANVVEDEEDFMETQAFPSKNTNNKLSEKFKMPKEVDILSGKEDEPFMTLSDKENLHPDTLEPITDFLPAQLFAMREAQCSSASTSQRRSGLNQTEPKLDSMPSDTVPVPLTGTDSNHKQLLAAADEEDDILTQAFPHPSKSTNISAIALPKNNCLNSTVLDQRAANKSPDLFLNEMENTVKKVDVFKMPVFGNTSKLTPPTGTSESDIDLLMCTPQLIKDHLQFSKADDVRKNILAAKNKSLFGDETDDGEDTEDDRNSECLVQLTNAPKNSKDFDKLLPHLKVDERNLQRKSLLTNDQIAAKEAFKKYKFNLSFGQEQDRLKAATDKSTTYSRDERHMNRDKEKETSEKSSNESEDNKRTSKRTRPREADKCEEAIEVPKSEERKIVEKRTRAKQKQVEQNTKDNKDEKTSAKKQKDKNDKKKVKIMEMETSENDEMQVAETNPKEMEQNTKDNKREQDSPSTSKAKSSSKKQKDKNDKKKVEIMEMETSENCNDDEMQVAETNPKEMEQNTKDNKREQDSPSTSKAKSSSKKQIDKNDKKKVKFMEKETSESCNDDEMQVAKTNPKETEQNTKDNKHEQDSASTSKAKSISKKQKDKNNKKKVKNLEEETSENCNDDEMQIVKTKPKEMEQNTKDSKDEQASASTSKAKSSSKKQKGENDKIKMKNLEEETSENGNDVDMEVATTNPKEVDQNTKDSKDEQESASTSKGKSNSKKQKNKNDKKKVKILETSEKTNDDEKEIAKTDPKEVKQSTKDSTDEQGSASKSKAKSTPKKQEDNTDMKQIQPKRRTTRSISISNLKGANNGQSSNAPTTSSAASLSSTESRLRSSSRLNKPNSASVNKSDAKTNTSSIETEKKPERKRKSQVPVQPEIEEKRTKRTISLDSKVSPSKPTKATPPKYFISTTMVDQEKLKDLAPIANGLWAVVKDPVDSNILVMDKAFRTYKFLLAMARGIPIVTSQWLQKLNETKSLAKAPINEFLFHDPVFEKTHKFVLAQSLQMANEKKGLFKGYTFLLTTRIQPQPIEMKAIIEYAGGVVLTKGPPAAEENQKLYLVSSLNDRKEWHKFRRLNNKIIIISTEAIMSSVMRQTTAALSNYELT